MSRLERTELLIGKENLDRLNRAKVLVFGVGGVGGYVCEALARTGVGRIGLVDNDCLLYTSPVVTACAGRLAGF